MFFPYLKTSQSRKYFAAMYTETAMKYLTFLDNLILENQQGRELQLQQIKEKYENDMKLMREEMESKFQEILTKIDISALK
jgi:hypothetical protein